MFAIGFGLIVFGIVLFLVRRNQVKRQKKKIRKQNQIKQPQNMQKILQTVPETYEDDIKTDEPEQQYETNFDIPITQSVEIFVNQAAKEKSFILDGDKLKTDESVTDLNKSNAEANQTEQNENVLRENTCESFVIKSQSMIFSDGLKMEDLEHMASYTFRSPSIIISPKETLV